MFFSAIAGKLTAGFGILVFPNKETDNILIEMVDSLPKDSILIKHHRRVVCLRPELCLRTGQSHPLS